MEWFAFRFSDVSLNNMRKVKACFTQVFMLNGVKPKVPCSHRPVDPALVLCRDTICRLKWDCSLDYGKPWLHHIPIPLQKQFKICNKFNESNSLNVLIEFKQSNLLDGPTRIRYPHRLNYSNGFWSFKPLWICQLESSIPSTCECPN